MAGVTRRILEATIRRELEAHWRYLDFSQTLNIGDGMSTIVGGTTIATDDIKRRCDADIERGQERIDYLMHVHVRDFRKAEDPLIADARKEYLARTPQEPVLPTDVPQERALGALWALASAVMDMNDLSVAIHSNSVMSTILTGKPLPEPLEDNVSDASIEVTGRFADGIAEYHKQYGGQALRDFGDATQIDVRGILRAVKSVYQTRTEQ